MSNKTHYNYKWLSKVGRLYLWSNHRNSYVLVKEIGGRKTGTMSKSQAIKLYKKELKLCAKN